MRAAWPLWFGFAWGIAVPLSDQLFPRVGPALLYAVLAAHCAVFAVIVWIRTGLRWFALSGIAAALATTMPVVHPAHHDWTTTDSLVLVGGIVTMGLCVFIQSQVDSAGWAELRRSLREANVGFVGVLLFRHIPDFRARRS